MCGILGAIGKFDRDSFALGLQRIAHRGPDGSGFWDVPEQGVLFGHRRLSIVELSDLGKQPMTDGELTIIFNGEIYNYRELRKQLQSLGYFFQSGSDTEVILKAYRHWGSACLEKFNGMWAFLLWDNHKNELFIARDRFGVKPLFYAFTSNGLVAGSEMKAITPLLDEIALSEDFEWCRQNIYEYETSSKALIKHIRRFPAGHHATFRPGENSLTPKRFWNTLDHLSDVSANYDEHVGHFRELFLDSCKIRMRSDVKIGTSLSGGLDSSAVAAAMRYWGNKDLLADEKNYPPDWQNAFVATFSGTELDEREYAEEVVRDLNLKGYFFEIDASRGIEKLNEYLWFFEELFLTSPIPMMEIYKGIKEQGISVSLDGHGADELLSGYGTTIFNAVKDAPFDVAGMRDIATIYKGLRNIDRSYLQVIIDGFAGRKNMLNFYLNKIIGFVGEEDELVRHLGHFNAALYKEFHSFILPTLLRNYDRYSMAAGVEVRMPFMDYRLVSYTFSLPWQSKLRKGFTKAILRDAIQPMLSEKVVRRRTKIGFATPFTNWFLGPWKEYIQDIVHGVSFNNSAVINPAAVRAEVEIFFSKKTPTFEDGPELWRHLMPYFWEISFYNRLKTK